MPAGVYTIERASHAMSGDPEQAMIDVAARTIERARAHGAEACDAVIVEQTSLSASCRLGKLEDIDRSEAHDLGLRVLVGKGQANVSSTDLSDGAIDALAERAVAMAKRAPEDPYAGLPEAGTSAHDWPDLDMFDAREVDADALRDMALEAEAAALEVEGVTNSLSAGAGTGTGGIVLANSNGFCGGYRSSMFSVSCAVVAGEGTAMERDYDYSSTVHFADLEAARGIGQSAGERAVARLDPKKVTSQSVPVVYDSRVSGGLIGHFAGAISGTSVARGTSFLKDMMGQQIFADGITIIDDPHRKRGLRSKPFDGEGTANARTTLVEDGHLKTWLLDTATARQLGLASTGHASRGTGGPPHPGATNLYLENGPLSPDALMSDIASGLYVTDLIGMGVNATTGDYSRGASGFWIENGKIAYPVSEITIAGNLKNMYRQLTPANDLRFRFGTNAPTVRIEGMTIAGK